MSGLFGGGGGSPAGQVVNVQQASNPLSPYVTQIGQGAQNAYNNFQVSPFTTQGLNLTAQRGLAGSPLTSAMQGQLTDTLQGKYLDPNTNPYLAKSVDDALGLAKSNYLGLYGGAAGNNIGNSGFQEGLTRNLGSVATNAYMNAYQQARQNQLQAASLVPSAQNMDYQNLSAVTGAGTGLQNLPFAGVNNYASTLGLAPGGGGTTTTSSPYFTNPAANALGLGMGAASLYNMGSQSGLWSGIGNMFGGGGGGGFNAGLGGFGLGGLAPEEMFGGFLGDALLGVF